MDWFAQIIEKYPQLLLSLVAVLIAFISLYISLRTRRMQSSNVLSDVYNKINSLALSDDKNLVAFDTLYFPELIDQDLEVKRKRWTAFISLNAAEHAFIARRHKAIDPDVAAPVLDDLLCSLLKSGDVQDALKLGYWDREFEAYANRIIKESYNQAN